ncbi:MAG: DUF2723 domain-containing protein [Ignavibacteriae bacterium]|nr:DUF2723 domain-containing protein [Ignavibacteriota bacterium]
MTATRLSPRMLGLVLGLAFFLLYLATLAPGVVYGDSGEYAAAAWTWGIPHPPGAPLYTLLAFLWAHVLPFGTVILRLNTLAALFGAAGVVFLFHAVRHMLPDIIKASSLWDWKKEGEADEYQISGSDTPILLAALFGAAATGLTPAWWSTALAAGADSFQLLLFPALLWAFVTSQTGDVSAVPQRGRRAAYFAFLLGVALTHGLGALALLPVFTIWYIVEKQRRKESLRGLLRCLPAFALGLAPVLLLPLRASADPAWNWGDPSSWGRFVDVVTSRPLRAYYFLGWDVFHEQSTNAIEMPPPLWSALFVAAAFSRVRALPWLLGMGICVALLAMNNAVFTLTPQLVPVFAIGGVFAAAVLFSILRIRRVWLRVSLAVPAVAVLAFHGGWSWLRNDTHDDRAVESYTRDILASVDRGAVLLTDEWGQCSSPALYLQQVEGLRQDVTLIDTRLLKRGWYVEQLQERYPSLFTGSEAAADALRAEYTKYETDGSHDPARLEELRSALARHLAAGNAVRRPVYATHALAGKLGAPLDAVPEGLVVRLFAPGRAIASTRLPIDTDPRVFTFTRPSRPNDFHSSIEDRYFRAYAARGTWHWRQGDTARANILFSRATQYAQFHPSDRWKQWAMFGPLLSTRF